MTVRGQVRDRRLRVDAPVDLPDGTEVERAVILDGDDQREAEERAPAQASEALLSRITRDASVMAGKACFRGMRITVGTVLGLLAAGRTEEEVLAEYPYLDKLDLRAALAYAAYRPAVCGEP
jgi:uncharacterized protein (DUF433 family)